MSRKLNVFSQCLQEKLISKILFFVKFFFDALDFSCLAIRSCRNCVMSNKVYCVNDNFEKCVKCVRLSRNCDLTISFALIKRIYEEQLRLKKEMRETRAKLSRLKKQLNFLKDKEKEMIILE